MNLQRRMKMQRKQKIDWNEIGKLCLEAIVFFENSEIIKSDKDKS